eukprot:TRINITY_DN389_c0_g1_i1.p1 TRINITY_DN389_c0_g1~~TRINITY_DN389_c0_g1_i1.p1  ORF type:complete len:769 (-),score=209.02 TRINITY_DN389_c0_g1_i1:235-2541(-)
MSRTGDLSDGDSNDGDHAEENLAGEFAEKMTIDVGIADAGDGEGFMAVRPWLGAVVNPSGFKAASNSAAEPDQKLKLEWVYGYRGDDVRGNVYYTATGKLLYFIAAAGIVYDPVENTQKLFAGDMAHTDDILCLALSPDGRTAATGQIGKKPFVLVWDTETMELIARLDKKQDMGIAAVAFSPDGKLLVSCADDNDKTVCLWDWENEKLVAMGRGGSDKTLDCAIAADGTVVTCGVKNMKFWTQAGGELKSNRGLFGSKGQLQTIMCIAFNSKGETLTGTFGGEVYIWANRNLSRIIPKVSNGPVYSVFTRGSSILTGGKDGKVSSWNEKGAKEWSVDIPGFGTETAKVRAVYAQGDKIAIGTSTGAIYEIDAISHKSQRVVQGHSSNSQLGVQGSELWGLATFPNTSLFVTTGDDGGVRLWDVHSHKLVREEFVGGASRAVDVSPDGKWIAVGTETGEVAFFDAVSFEQKKRVTIFQAGVNDIKYSPDGKKLAVGSHVGKGGSHDSYIAIVDTASGTKLGQLRGHHEAITHIDWSSDSKFLQSNSRGYELLFWDTNSFSQVTSATAMKDVQWATWTCVLGFPVQGIWPPAAMGCDIHSVQRNGAGDVLATGDNFGRVNLFRYPCTTKDARSSKNVGHSSHVTTVRFTKGDEYVISTGGHDRAIFQWRYSGGAAQPASTLQASAAPSPASKPAAPAAAVTPAATADGDTTTLQDWLASLGLAELAPNFEKEDIGLDMLPDLAESDLETLGIKMGPRKKIVAAAKLLRQ